jgi:hypothetical protein
MMPILIRGYLAYRLGRNTNVLATDLIGSNKGLPLIYSWNLGHLIADDRTSAAAAVDDTMMMIRKAGKSCSVAARAAN